MAYFVQRRAAPRALASSPTFLAAAVAALYAGMSLLPLDSLAQAQSKSEAQLPEVGVKAKRDDSQGYTPQVTSTGSKTDVLLKDLPAAVVVIPKEVLQEQAAKTFDQAMTNASSVQPVYGGGYGFANNYVIRGLRMRFLRDGLADGPDLINYYRQFADVESIEILKGPGSAVYGSAAPGGTINITTKKPQRDFAVGAELSVGGFGTRQFIGDITGSLGPVPGRLIVNSYHTDGIRGLKFDVNEIMPTLEWKPNSAHTLTFDYDYRQNKAVVDNYGILFNRDGTLLNVSQNTRYYSPFNRTKQEINRGTVTHNWAINPDVSLRTAVMNDQRDISIVRNAGGNAANAAGLINGRNGRTQSDDANYTNFSTELTYKLRGESVNQTLLAGVELERTRNRSNRYTYNLLDINALNPVILETNVDLLAKTRAFDKTVASRTNSFYAQDQIELGKQWRVRLGARWDRVNWTDDGIGNAIVGATPVGGIYRKIDVTKTLPSYQAGIVYQPLPQVSLYGGVARGQFMSVQTESINLSLLPEKSSQIELGAKTSFFDDKLSVNTTLFQTRRNNYLVTLNPAIGPEPVGQAKSNGFEIDVVGNPLPGLNVIANYAYLNARTTSNETTTVANVVAVATSLNGKQLTATPRNAYSLWGTYTLQTGAAQGLGFGLGLVHKDASFADSIEALKVPGYTIYNAALFYKKDFWEVALNVKNLSNKQYFSVPTFAGALPGDPRQVLLSVKLKL